MSVGARVVSASSLAALIVLGSGRQLGVPIDAEPLRVGPQTGTSNASALTGTWVRTGGPLGGLGYDIRVQPDNPDIMYVTDAFAGVFKSTNAGATWTSLNAGIDARTGPSNDVISVFCLTLDPNNYNTLWIGLTGIRGVYRSTDAGATWVKKDTGIIENNGLTIRGIGVKPGDSNVVFAAGEVSSFVWNGTPKQGREFDLVQGVIYRSTNAGQSWSEVWRGDNLARYILFDPTNPTTMYASTGIFDREAKNSNFTTSAPGGVGVLKSTDGGTTWTAINNGLGNLYVGSLFIHPTNPQILLAGTGNVTYSAGAGVYRTTNGGATWQLAGAPPIKNGLSIESVEYSTGTPTIAYAAGDSSEGFYKSTDSGATWTLVSAKWGPSGIRAGQPIDMQLDPRNAQRLFVNNYAGGNFLSTDGGQTWSAASTGYTGANVQDVAVDPTYGARVYAMPRSGPFSSTDGGATWNGINPSSPGTGIIEGAAIAVHPSNPNTLLISNAQRGVTYGSTDRGVTWTLVTDFTAELNGLSVSDRHQQEQGMRTFAFASSDPSKVYGGFGILFCAREPVSSASLCGLPTIASIFTSADGGATWTRHNGVVGNRTVSRIVVDPQNALRAWASTLGGGVFITTDGGNTWTASNSGLTSLNVWSLALTATNANVLYAGTVASGVFKSTDGGGTWSAASAGMSATEPVSALVVSPVDANVVYAGSRASGVYLSTNAGASWTLDSTGLRQRAIQALSLSASGTVLYAATQGEGVYRLGSVPSQIPGAPTGLTASSSGSSVTLGWRAPTSGFAPDTYIIEAGLASGLADLGNFSTGTTETTFSATGVRQGTYYVRVRAGNAAGTSEASNEAILMVGGGCTTAPGAPGSLVVVSVSGGAVVLAWNAASGNPTSYVVEAGSRPGGTNLANSDLGSPATSLTATGVGPGTYYVRIRAKNPCGLSSASNEIILSVP
jgi:hypothetical protein